MSSVREIARAAAERDDQFREKSRESRKLPPEDHRWWLIQASPLREWFPDAQWKVKEVPEYPYRSVIVYDESSTQDDPPVYFTLRQVMGHIMVELTTPSRAYSGRWFRVEVRSLSHLGQLLRLQEKLKKKAAG